MIIKTDYLLDRIKCNGEIVSIETVLSSNSGLTFSRHSNRLVLINDSNPKHKGLNRKYPWFVSILERNSSTPIIAVKWLHEMNCEYWKPNNYTCKVIMCPDSTIPFEKLLAMTKYWDKDSSISICLNNFKP